MNDKYLMAVVRIPVRVTSDGNLSLLNEYSKIPIKIRARINGTLTIQSSKKKGQMNSESFGELGKIRMIGDDLIKLFFPITR